jgi:exopolysaccharide biosynthesis polyprenyl glycosylphosphotransferase
MAVEAGPARPTQAAEIDPEPRVSRDIVVRRMLGLGDALATTAAMYLAVLIPGRDHGLVWGLLAAPVMIVLFKLYGLYDRDVKRISHSTVDDLPWLAHAILLGALLLWLYSRYTPLNRLDLQEVLIFAGSSIVLASFARVAIRHGAARLVAPERVLLVGRGEMADMLVRKLRGHPEYRLRVVATMTPLSSRGPARLSADSSIADEMAELATKHGVTRVLLSSADVDDSDLNEMLRRCRVLSLRVGILPGLWDMLGPGLEVDAVEGVTVLGVSPPRLPRSSRAVKRAIDLAVAGVLLALFAPVLILAALAIKLDTPGPVLFSQERIGKAGRRFRLFKLRTMVADAEEHRERLLAESTDPNWLFLDVDPRITRVGRWLRRLSLDELPQLLNVLRGHMSMVGPRPLIPTEDQRVTSWARGRLDLTPGITGYWQVLGRTQIPFEEMVKLDYLYVVSWSLWEDVRLMLKTLPVVLKGRGAN